MNGFVLGVDLGTGGPRVALAGTDGVLVGHEKETVELHLLPRKLDVDSDQSQALTTPLSITGCAEELDRELPGQLLSFTESVVKTGSNLEE